MKVFLICFSVFLFVLVFITQIKDEYWIFRILEYPRLQKLMIVLVTLGLWLFYFPLRGNWSYISVGLLLVSSVYLLYKVVPYTVFFPKEVKTLKPKDKKSELIIFTANVYQENKAYERLLSQIWSCDPDIVFLVETSEDWDRAVSRLEDSYPYKLECPLNNTYGMLLYSRLKLEDASVQFRVKDDIPSVEGKVVLPSGEKIEFYGLHPEPPVPGESMSSKAKDKELMKVALKVKNSELPCLVFGDLNDVAWSYTTELFRKNSELLDPRRGRGFFSTFSAHSYIMRFPLDYIFCSSDFGLISMKKLPKNGSDHFAICTHLILEAALKAEQKTPDASKGERKDAKDKASE